MPPLNRIDFSHDTQAAAVIASYYDAPPLAYVHSYGCQQNVNDGEKIKTLDAELSAVSAELRMAALSGVTTCLDMAGPMSDILRYAPETGCGIHAAVLEGFDPKGRFGTDKPTRDELGVFVEESLAAGAVGVKIMGGHWPLPLETSSELIRVANERDAYVAWHAGSTTAGSNLLGMRETIEAAGMEKLHLAHINAYCRGRVKAVEEETAEAIELLKTHPNIWCESYVSPMNGTILTCDAEGVVIDHVTRNCLATFGRTPDKAGMIEAFRHGEVQAIVERGGVSVLVGGEEGLELWLAAETATAGSFPVNPATSRFLLAQAKRADGSFVVDAIGTDGGCIPRNVLLSVGLSLVKFGALTLTEFVQKTSLNQESSANLVFLEVWFIQNLTKKFM